MSDSQPPPFNSADADELPDTEEDSLSPPPPHTQAAPENGSAVSISPLPIKDNTNHQSVRPPSRNADWLLGQTIANRYVIEEKIGEGSFGAVYRARDVHNKMFARQLVIKFLKEKEIDNKRVIGKFQREVEALTRLDNHPGIVGVLDAGEFHNLPYIVLQYVNGVSLRERIKPGGMELEEIAEIVRQTASALAEGHSQEVLHRDLKPENIMLRNLGSGETSVAVIDFGVAKVYNSRLSLSSQPGALAGTCLYMSPEQLRGQNKTMTPASEVYSLGVITYEMLTGILPFYAHDVFSLRQLQEEGLKVKPQALRRDLPSAAQNVLLRALAFNPADRYQNIKTFGDNLARTLLVPAPTLVSDRAKKRPTLVMVALGLALAAAAAFAIWQLLRNKLPPTNTSATSSAATNNITTSASALPVLAYSLTVQKVFDGRLIGAPQEYTGAEMFGNGWKFKFNVTPTEDGYFYLLNAAPQPDGSTEWNVLFPTPKNNNGQAKINGLRKQTFGWYVFDNIPGQEKLWLIWSRHEPIPDLEAAVKAATKTALVIKEPRQVVAITNFLQSLEKEAPLVMADKQQKRTVIKSEHATWACLVELRHDKY